MGYEGIATRGWGQRAKEEHVAAPKEDERPERPLRATTAGREIKGRVSRTCPAWTRAGGISRAVSEAARGLEGEEEGPFKGPQRQAQVEGGQTQATGQRSVKKQGSLARPTPGETP